jgi:hypothetical protein
LENLGQTIGVTHCPCNELKTKIKKTDTRALTFESLEQTIGVTHCPCNELPAEEKSSANELVGDHQDLA